MANEIFKDEQLNDVAGGFAEETLADYRLMRDLGQKGVIKFDGKQITRNEALTHLLTVSGHTDCIKNFVL